MRAMPRVNFRKLRSGARCNALSPLEKAIPESRLHRRNSCVDREPPLSFRISPVDALEADKNHFQRPRSKSATGKIRNL
jgi:hypothetical protein